MNLPGLAFPIRDPADPQLRISTTSRHKDFELALWCARGDTDDAYRILDRSKQLFRIHRAGMKNTNSKRMSRSRRKPESKVYMEFCDPICLRRRALLEAMLQHVSPRRDMSKWERLHQLVCVIIAEMLRHDRFCMTVGLMRGLAAYTTPEILWLHQTVDGASKKDERQVGRVTGYFREALLSKGFILQKGPRTSKHSVPTAVLNFVTQTLADLAPYPAHDPNIALRDGEAEKLMKIANILHIDDVDNGFDRYALKAKVDSFRQRATLPLDGDDPFDMDGDPIEPRGPGSTRIRFDPARLERITAEREHKEASFEPCRFAIFVDGIERQEFSASDVCPLKLKAGAGVVEVVGFDRNNEKMTLAAHFLTYAGARSESCSFKIKGLGTIYGKFVYSRNNRAKAEFSLERKAATPKVLRIKSSPVRMSGVVSGSRRTGSTKRRALELPMFSGTKGGRGQWWEPLADFLLRPSGDKYASVFRNAPTHQSGADEFVGRIEDAALLASGFDDCTNNSSLISCLLRFASRSEIFRDRGGELLLGAPCVEGEVISRIARAIMNKSVVPSLADPAYSSERILSVGTSANFDRSAYLSPFLNPAIPWRDLSLQRHIYGLVMNPLIFVIPWAVLWNDVRSALYLRVQDRESAEMVSNHESPILSGKNANTGFVRTEDIQHGQLSLFYSLGKEMAIQSSGSVKGAQCASGRPPPWQPDACLSPSSIAPRASAERNRLEK